MNEGQCFPAADVGRAVATPTLMAFLQKDAFGLVIVHTWHFRIQQGVRGKGQECLEL
jgi:hypothetical protein